MGGDPLDILLKLRYIPEYIIVDTLQDIVVTIVLLRDYAVGVMYMTRAKALPGKKSALRSEAAEYLLQVSSHCRSGYVPFSLYP